MQSSERSSLRIVHYSYPRNPRVDLLEQLKPFASDRRIEIGEARNIPTGLCEALYKPLRDRLCDVHKNDRNGAGLLFQRGGRWGGTSDQRVRPQLHQLLCEGLDTLDISARPTELDADIPSLDPAKLRKPLPQCHDLRRGAGIGLNDVHQHANPPHALGRPQREWPCNRRPAQSSDELPPS